MLELQHLNATALSGPLVIGDGLSQTPTAIVRLRDDDQIADAHFVTGRERRRVRSWGRTTNASAR